MGRPSADLSNDVLSYLWIKLKYLSPYFYIEFLVENALRLTVLLTVIHRKQNLIVIS